MSSFKSPPEECANKLAQILRRISNLTRGDGKMMMQHSSTVKMMHVLEPYTLVMEHLNLWPLKNFLDENCFRLKTN